MAFLPPDAPAWDDASNNTWLIAGKGTLILNPPSAWAVAKRDAPEVAELCWTHGFPVGPKGRFAPFVPYFWTVWNFSKNKAAAKSLLKCSPIRVETHGSIAVVTRLLSAMALLRHYLVQ
jgi:ABC-type glycerol-3-phosphate transport system substrate-binding protein